MISGSGMKALWVTVYASKTAYARALRTHLLSSAAMVSLVLNNPGCMSGIDVEHLDDTFKGLLAGNIFVEDVGDELQQQATPYSINSMDYLSKVTQVDCELTSNSMPESFNNFCVHRGLRIGDYAFRLFVK